MKSKSSAGGWEFALPAPRRGPRGASELLYVQIVQAVVADIRRGRLLPGQRLPGSRPLAARLGVHRNTVLAAYAELQAEGWIQTDRARQTCVCESLPEPAATSSPRASRHAAEPGFALDPRTARERAHTTGELLSDGTPDLRLTPRVALARAYRRVLRGRDPLPLGYGDARGHLRLRRALAEMLSATRGLRAGADDVLVTRGSQMALELLGRVLCGPRDVVAVEALGYAPAWRALGAGGAELVPVPLDAEGLRVDQLAQLSARRRLRAVYVTPHHQYPTTATLSAARRLALLELARRQRFAIIEDDYDHEFHYQGRPVLPLASADEAGVVAYVGTLSKILAPGLRLGYLVAPAILLERCVELRERMDRQGDLVSECAVAELIEEGELQRHVRRMRRVYQARRDALLDALARYLPGVIEAAPPPGGMALWARAQGADVDRWAARAAARGQIIWTARTFAFDAQPAPYLRLGYAVRSAEESARQIERLARVLPRRNARG
ncbi:MAG TPA: PLP-dependent aminotransferase family protein [Polyangiaceae bacterium]|nr:PLP-dependent aminotransferase family protein [Polyangiaceae bacterium]